MIHVAILEDLKLVAEILKKQICAEEDMNCTHVYHNAEDAMLFIPKIDELDILIVDIGLPRASGIEAIQSLKETCPELQFCMFTVYEDDEKVFNSIKSGANGYILKGTETDELIRAIRELYQGGAPMSPSIARRILEIFKSQEIKKKNRDLPLTERELEILELLKDGLLYKEIGAALSITTGTVKQHLHKIYKKLHVSNRTEAINKYLDR